MVSFSLAGSKVARPLCWLCNTIYNSECMKLYLHSPIYHRGSIMNYSQPQFCLYAVITQWIQSSQLKLSLTDDEATGADPQFRWTWLFSTLRGTWKSYTKQKGLPLQNFSTKDLIWPNWIQFSWCASALTSHVTQNSHTKFDQNLLRDWEMEYAQTYNICWLYGKCKECSKCWKKTEQVNSV